MYHSVGSARDPYHLRVKPERLAAHLARLRERCEIVPLAEVSRRSRRDRAAVTFDDGYVDNLYEAKPVLEKYGMPATVFVTASAVPDGATFWYDRLAHLVLDAPSTVSHIELNVAGTPLWADLRSESARARAHIAIHRRVRNLQPAEISSTLDALAESLATVPDTDTAPRSLNTDELRSLGEGGLVDIGAHTLTHPVLSQLPANEQWSEIHGSRRLLQDLTGMRVTSFAYPFGTPDSFTDATERLVADAGFELAVTSTDGRSTRDLLRLPRQYVDDWDEAEFVRCLDGWLR